MLRRLLLLLPLVVVVSGATNAQAVPFGVTYNGGLFTIELISPSATGTDFTVRYVADLTDFTGDNGNQDYIYGVGFRPTPSEVSGFSGSDGSGWTFRADELSANGCRDGSDSFACASTWNGTTFQPLALSTVGALGEGPVHEWLFHLTYASPVTLNLEGVSIKAAFSLDDTGETGRGLMSLTTSQVPEPATLLLLGVGLLGTGLFASRRRR